MIDIGRFTLDQINADGGINGRMVEPIIIDGQSDSQHYRLAATKMIKQHEVAVIVGCWTSAHRKAIIPIVEQAKGLLIYPNQYEGVETAKSVLCTGSLPNQQITPATRWAVESIGRKVYLIGSDYIYPRIVSHIIREQLGSLRAEVVGEQFMPLGTRDCSALVADIERSGADLILNNLNGEINQHFFDSLSRSSSNAKALSFSIGQEEINNMAVPSIAGHSFAASYFDQTVSAQNQAFIQQFHQWLGRPQAFGAVGYSVFAGLQLWAAAARMADSTQPDSVRHAVNSVHVEGPLGLITAAERHMFQRLFVGQMSAQGELDIVYQSARDFMPEPYPPTRTPEQWRRMVQDYYNGWGGNWVAPMPEERRL